MNDGDIGGKNNEGGGGEAGEGQGNPPLATRRGPRAGDETLWRAKAKAALDRAAELEAKVKDLAAELAQAREALDAAERRRTLERELTVQGAIDVEAASLLTEAAIAAAPQADVRAAIADLRRRKPYLFRGRPAPPGSSALDGPAAERVELDRAADRARRAGDRASLMGYLRARRARSIRG